MGRLPVQIKFQLIDQVTKGMDNIGRSFRKTTSEVGRLEKTLNGASSKFEILKKKMGVIAGSATVLGAGLTAAVTVPMAGLAKDVVMQGAAFEQAMNKIQSATQATGPTLQKLGNDVRRVALGSQFMATEVSEAASALGKAGFSADEVGKSLKAVTGLSLIEGLGLEETANFLSSTLTVFGKTSDMADHFADVMVKASGDSQISLQQLRDSMKYVGLSAARMGYSIEDTSALIAGMGKVGIFGEMAGTTARNLITSLFSRGRSIEALKEAGVTESDLFGKDATGKLSKDIKLPFEKILENLAKRNLSSASLNKAFGSEFGPNISGMLARVEVFKEMREGMNDAAGALKLRTDPLNKGLNAALKRFQGTWQEFSIRLTESGALDAITKIIDKVGELLIGFTNLSPGIQKTVLTLAFLAAVAGPLIGTLGALGVAIYALKGFAALAGVTVGAMAGGFALLAVKVLAIGAVITGIGLLIADLIVNFDEFTTFLTDIWNDPKKAWEKFLYWAESRLGWLRDMLSVIPGISALKVDPSIMGRREWDLPEDDLKKQPITPFKNPDEWMREFNRRKEDKITLDFKNVPKGVEITQDHVSGNISGLPVGRTKNVAGKSNYRTSTGMAH